MSIKLDQIDHKVLEILQQNAKITNAQLSKEIGLSPAPTLERVKKLELAGIIESYHAQLNRDKVGLGVTTFVTITLTGHKKQVTESFVSQVNLIPEVIECHHVTGSGDFLLKIIAKDISSYQKLMLEKINEIFFCNVHLKRASSTTLFARCFVARPCTRSRHIRKEDGFISLRITSITACSFKPNWAVMASKGVRSSHAISTTRSISWSVSIICSVFM